MNNIKLSNIEDLKFNLDNKFQITQSKKASIEILKMHRYFLNQLDRLPKQKKSLDSPFALFSNKKEVSYAFKATFANHLSYQERLDRVAQFNHPKSLLDIIQTFQTLQSFLQPVEIQKLQSNLSPTQFYTDIIGVTKETNGYVTIKLKRPEGWDFQSGQYLEIKSENSKAKKPAILAIASGMNKDFIEITGKPNSNPEHANFCLNGLVGERLLINGPLGSSFPTHLITPNTSVILMGGGSGLTALKSLIASMPDHPLVKMIYSTKSYQELIYKEEMKLLKMDGHIISLTQEKKAGFEEGRITQHLQLNDIKPNSLYFLCGPESLVIETAKYLVERGVSKESIYGSLPVLAKDGGPVFRGDHPKMKLI